MIVLNLSQHNGIKLFHFINKHPDPKQMSKVKTRIELGTAGFRITHYKSLVKVDS